MDPAQARASALDELSRKSFADIHRETAITWAWRARAASSEFDRIELRHEAVEHAAISGDKAVLFEVRRIVQAGSEFDSAYQKALAELRVKSLDQIQKETAIKWAYRAWAAYQLKLTVDAIDYEQEAFEHAALSEDDALLDLVLTIVAGR